MTIQELIQIFQWNEPHQDELMNFNNLYQEKLMAFFDQAVLNNIKDEVFNLSFISNPQISSWILKTHSGLNKSTFTHFVQKLYTRWKKGPLFKDNFLSPCHDYIVQEGTLLKNHCFGGVLVDLDFPVITYFIKNENRSEIELSINEKDLILTKIEKSLTWIKESFPEAYPLVKTQVSAIYVRKNDLEKPRGTSHNSEIGSIYLTGIEKESATPVKIAELIIHESIHHIFHRYEFLHGQFVKDIDGKEVHQKKVISPWSNEVIPLYSFSHACFVWYAIYHFYKKLPSNLPNRTSQIDKAASGFKKGFMLTQPLTKGYGGFPDELCQAIDLIQTEIIDLEKN